MPKAAPDGTVGQRLLRFVNDERSARGVAPLSWDEDLAQLARDWSTQMMTTGRFEHRDLSDAMARHLPRGAYAAVGENIFMGEGTLAKAGWAHRSLMHSDGHRVNIVQPGFDRIGVGATTDRQGRLWVTENFARSFSGHAPEMRTGTPPLYPVVHDGPSSRPKL